MPSKKTNPWIKFLQSYTKKQQKTNSKYTYKNAIGDKNAKIMYKKMKGGFLGLFDKVEKGGKENDDDTDDKIADDDKTAENVEDDDDNTAEKTEGDKPNIKHLDATEDMKTGVVTMNPVGGKNKKTLKKNKTVGGRRRKNKSNKRKK